MARYFFDFHDGGFYPDDVGSECADIEQARAEAMRSLPEIARFAIPKHGDHQSYTVLVRDDRGRVVYTATLTFSGLRLHGEAAPFGAPAWLRPAAQLDDVASEDEKQNPHDSLQPG